MLPLFPGYLAKRYAWPRGARARMHANKTFFYFLLALKLQKYTLFVFAVYTAFLTTQNYYYDYLRNETSIHKSRQY